MMAYFLLYLYFFKFVCLFLIILILYVYIYIFGRRVNFISLTIYLQCILWTFVTRDCSLFARLLPTKADIAQDIVDVLLLHGSFESASHAVLAWRTLSGRAAAQKCSRRGLNSQTLLIRQMLYH